MPKSANLTAIADLMADLIKRGRYFTPVKRPKGFRLRAPKACYANAGALAVEGRAQYVEGYVLPCGNDYMFHHAWVTTDGSNAIEVTLREPGRLYFGLVYDTKAVARAILARNMHEPMQQPMFSMLEKGEAYYAKINQAR